MQNLALKQSMNREYHKWLSPHLNRDMELLVFGESGAKVLVFPTRCGHFYDYENFRMLDALIPKITDGYLQLYCIDSIDEESLYCFWCHPADRIQRHLQYERYILEEVLPFMDAKNPHPCTISHGCSLGAYHATNIAFRHPHRFQKLLALSGRYDLTSNLEGFRDLFDGYYNDDVYFNMPSHFINNLSDPDILQSLKEMDITLVVGNEDPFFENNRDLSTQLWNKEIWHALHIWDGRAHSGYYWRRMVALYL